MRDWEIKTFAEFLDVPEWFLVDGITGRPSEQLDSALIDELRDHLDRKYDDVIRRLDSIGEQLRVVTVDRERLTE